MSRPATSNPTTPTKRDVPVFCQSILFFSISIGWSCTSTDPFDLPGSIHLGAYKKLFCSISFGAPLPAGGLAALYRVFGCSVSFVLTSSSLFA